MNMSGNPYALLVELTIIVALLVSLVVYAMLRFMEAARTSRKRSKDSKEMVLLSAALHDAVAKLQAQEGAAAAGSDASEALSEEIILSLTAGLLVVDLNAKIRILNPAGRRVLGLPHSTPLSDYRQVLAEPLSQVIEECLAARGTHHPRTSTI